MDPAFPVNEFDRKHVGKRFQTITLPDFTTLLFVSLTIAPESGTKQSEEMQMVAVESIATEILHVGVAPVVCLDDPSAATDVARALAQGAECQWWNPPSQTPMRSKPCERCVRQNRM